jgi:fatty acid desaturase
MVGVIVLAKFLFIIVQAALMCVALCFDAIFARACFRIGHPLVHKHVKKQRIGINYYYYLYIFYIYFFISFTRAHFVVDLWAVELARK